MDLEQVAIQIRVEAEEALATLAQTKAAFEALEKTVQGGTLATIAQKAAQAASALAGMDGTAKLFREMNHEEKELNKTTRELADRVSKVTQKSRALKEAKALLKENAQGTDLYAKAMTHLGLSAGASAKEVETALAKQDAELLAQTESIRSAIFAQVDALSVFVKNADANPALHIDTTPAQAAIAALFPMLNSLLSLMGMAGVSSPKAASGGGGGKKASWYDREIKAMEHLRKVNQLSYEEELAYLTRIEKQKGKLKKDEKLDLEERLYQVREDLRQKAIEDDYDAIAHKKHMNDITLEMELAALEKMKTHHAMTTEELIALEEKLFDVREAIRERNLQADYDAIAHRKAMGEMSLAQELAALEAIGAAHVLNDAERLALDEQVYQLRRDIRRKAIEDDYADMEHQKRMGALSYAQEVEWLARIRDKHQMTAEEQRQIEEELFAAREALREEILRLDYAEIEHKKRMGELTLEQEKELLTAIKAAREMNAEELLEIAEKLYEKEDAIRNRDAQSITKLMTALTRALQERYKEMRDEETTLLTASKANWKTWADENVDAIQAQIDALDALIKKEDSDKQDAKELKQIASLEEQILFEQDAYNRRQLQEQLSQAIAQREARLRKESIEAEKAALRAQQDVIAQKAQTEQDLIDKQIESLKANYEERLTQLALEAEAEKLLLSGNQEAILALIAGYAPDYNGLGTTLGEALLDGFTSVVGNVYDFIHELSRLAAEKQNEMKALSYGATEAFYAARQGAISEQSAETNEKSVTINQEINFNQPIDSPYDVAQKMQRLNEELARYL